MGSGAALKKGIFGGSSGLLPSHQQNVKYCHRKKKSRNKKKST